MANTERIKIRNATLFCIIKQDVNCKIANIVARTKTKNHDGDELLVN